MYLPLLLVDTGPLFSEYIRAELCNKVVTLGRELLGNG